MRKLLNSGLVCGALAVCCAPVASQTMDAPAGAPVCRPVTGTADIDGTQQQFSGIACQQPDGSWQIMQGDEDTLVYPQGAVYYGPWYGWWPPVFVGASFVFVDRFHHFHPMHHVSFGHTGMRTTAGWHGGGMHGGGTVWGGMGGGHRR
jgi:hypothetical protein